MRIHKDFFHYVIPSMLAFALSGIYAIADGFFVGNALGDNALAAINVAYPLTAFLQAVGTGIGMGGAIRYAISKGNQNDHLGQQYWKVSPSFDVFWYSFDRSVSMGSAVHPASFWRFRKNSTVGRRIFALYQLWSSFPSVGYRPGSLHSKHGRLCHRYGCYGHWILNKYCP